MSKFFIEQERVRISFDDGEWVDVKEELSQEDSDYIMNRMVGVKPNEQSNVELKLGQSALLERSIVDWSFAENGVKVPITPENISSLRSRYRSKVLAEVDRLNKDALSFVQKN